MILAAAASIALALPSRDALVGRWQRANPAHTLARLDSVPPAARGTVGVPDLQRLASHELAIPGRYQLAHAPPPHESLWTRIWNWIANRWERLWRALFGRAHVGPKAAANIGDVLLAVIGLVLLYVIIRLLGSLQFSRSSSRVEIEALDERPSPRALYNLARRAANDGDYGTAALLLFAATVALLDRRGAVELKSSSTVGDLRRSLRKRDTAMLPPFDAVAAPFVQRLYAERPIDEPQWQRALSAYESLATTMTS